MRDWILSGTMERGPRPNSIRLPGHNYSSPGYYFITICTYQRQELFKDFVGADLCVRPSPDNLLLGWLDRLRGKYPIEIDAFAILPDHVHIILGISAGYQGPPISEIIKWYKSQTTNAMIRAVHSKQQPPFFKHIWQRGYYDHILRSDKDLQDTRQYILNNPLKWISDKE